MSKEVQDNKPKSDSSVSVPFTDAELRCIIELFTKHKNLLEQRHCPVVTESKKRRAWDMICDHVNRLNVCGSGGRRTIEQIKKKVSDMKRNAKDWLQSTKYPKTGGGKGKQKLWYYDTVLDEIIGRDSPTLTCVQGGCETGKHRLLGPEVNEIALAENTRSKAKKHKALDHGPTETESGTEQQREPSETILLPDSDNGTSSELTEEVDDDSLGTYEGILTQSETCTQPGMYARLMPAHKAAATVSKPASSTPKPASSGQVLKDSSFCFESETQGPTGHVAATSNKKRQNCDYLVQLKIQRVQGQREELNRKKEEEQTRKSQILEDMAVAREQMRFKREEIELEKAKVELERVKMALELDKYKVQTAKLQLMQLENEMNVNSTESVTLQEFNADNSLL